VTGARVVIVGAGQAAGRTAQALRRLGHAGPIAILGDEPHGPYERPPLSKDILLGRAQPDALLLLSEEKWSALDVVLRCNARVAAIDRAAGSVRLEDGARIGYDILVLATGARPRAFPGRVEGGAEMLQLRNLRDAECLRARLVPRRTLAVIGAGFIGMELAASARQLGVEVALIEAAPRPLARVLPTVVAGWFVAMHRAQGVTVHLGCAVERVAPGRVLLADGRSVGADTIVVGIGARPNDELAAAAGLPVRDGVLVDGAGRSSDPSIFAVGDVARQVDPAEGLDQRLESWRNAEDSAQAVAAAICGAPAPRRPIPWFWTDQYGRNFQLAGRPDDAHERIDMGDPAAGPALSYFLEGGLVRGAVGVDCGREMRGAMKLIEGGRPVTPADLPRLRDRTPPLSAACLSQAPQALSNSTAP
jgi:3-phenylpropionate/trans-cinnamate dioxygenase ferredoxin reductase component